MITSENKINIIIEGVFVLPVPTFHHLSDLFPVDIVTFGIYVGA